MIDRRTKNAEIFRDTEQRYSTDQFLREPLKHQYKNKLLFLKNQLYAYLPLAKQEKRM